MKKYLLILPLIVLFIVCSGCFSACSVTDAPCLFTVSGIVACGEKPVSDIEILVNGHSAEPSLFTDKSGAFKLQNLKEKDVVSFVKDGYSVEPLIVEYSLTNKIFEAVRKRCTVSISYDATKGKVDGGGKYPYGEKAVLTATVNDLSEFAGFYENGVLLSGETSCSITVEGTRLIEARFTDKLFALTIENVPDDALVEGGGMYKCGATVKVSAKDNERFVFDKWIVNNDEIKDKTYNYVISSGDNVIYAYFKERLNTPVVNYADGVVEWTETAGAKCYVLTVDGQAYTVDGCRFDLGATEMLSGRYEISVYAVVSDDLSFVDSSASVLSVDYKKRIDVPAESGFDNENGAVFFRFSKVNSAVSYKLILNDKVYDDEDLHFEIGVNSVRTELTELMSEKGIYRVSVVAVAYDCEQNSLPTDAVSYTVIPQCAAPRYELDGHRLKWSHNNAAAKFRLEYNNGLVIYLDDFESYDLLPLYEQGVKSFVLVVAVEGYKDNSVKIDL